MTPHWKEVSDPAVTQTKPLVSVAMLAYNHSAFIGEAIEGVAMQKAPFPIELVIGVDQSPDNTLEIVLGYQKRYPQLVRALVPQERLGALQNCLLTLGACRGNYIAICEGDDFWIQPEKLAKQVDVLERDSSLAGCFHECYNLNQKTGLRRLRVGDRKIDTRPDTASIIREKNTTTCSILFRNCISISEFAELARGVVQVDHMLCLLISEHGAWQYLAEPMAVYRIHDGGIWSGLSVMEALRQQLRFMHVLAASKRYPALRELILAIGRNNHRLLGITLAREKNLLKSLYHYGRSIGPKGALQDRQVRSSKYWRVLAHGVASRVGLEAPLVWLWKRLTRSNGNS